MKEDKIKQAWDRLIKGLNEAEEVMEKKTSELSPTERAEGYRALIRALAANIDKVESDGVYPLPIHDNQPNHKWFLENPDGYYLHMQVNPAYTYRLSGNLGDACYTSFTLYKGKGDSLATKETAKLTADQLTTTPDGEFELIIGGDKGPAENHIPISDDSGLFWVRQLFNDINNERHGVFRLENISCKELPPTINVDDFCEGVMRLGAVITVVSNMIFVAYEMQISKYPPNDVRVWSEMQSGAMFTSDDIDYQIGSFQLEEGEALELSGVLPKCKHWNIVLYSRFLNSLEHRYRKTSLTGGKLKLDDKRHFSIIIGDGVKDKVNWLDTEGRKTGLFVIRAVGAEEDVLLPSTEVKSLKC